MIRWLRHAWFQEGVVTLVCSTLVLTPFLATMNVVYADEVIDEANKGQDTGANLLLNYQVPTINTGAPGDPLGANELNIQELFPGYDPATPSQITDLSDLSSTPEDLSTQGVAQQFMLQGGTGDTAEAYQSIRDASNNPHYATIDMRNDNFLDRSRDILSGTDPILNEILTACAENVTAGDPGTDTVTRLEDIWTCSQLRTGTAGSCTVERDFVLVPVATQVVLTVVGGVCVPSAGSSGNDLSDWQSLLPWTVGSGGGAAAAPANYCLWSGPNPTATGWFLRVSISAPFSAFEISDGFCGEFDTQVPTSGECGITARQLEHACRNAPPIATLDGWQINTAHPEAGPAGACGAYSPGPVESFDGTLPVDYTGCDADRQSFCRYFADEFTAECSGRETCGQYCSSGKDQSDWALEAPIGGTPLSTPFLEPNGWCGTPIQWSSEPYIFSWKAPLAAAREYSFPGFCGERDNQIPTVAECQNNATQFEHACRNGRPFPFGVDGLHINSLLPELGPVGACASYLEQYPGLFDGAFAVDYTGCDATRQTFCKSQSQKFFAECTDTCVSGTCAAEDNIALYNFQSIYDNASAPEVHACLTNRMLVGLGSAPDLSILDYLTRTFSWGHSEVLDPGDWQVIAQSTDVCGTTPSSLSCSDQGQVFYDGCVAPPPSGPTTKLYRGGTPADVPAYCAAERATFETNCSAANSCLAGGAAALLTGTETITSPGLGPGFLEILANQNVFGTTVDFEETGFNPGDYGLIAGEYVVADHTVAGTGVTSSTIDDGGSYGSNWDFTTTLTLQDSPGFTVEATLYQIANNGFIFTGCSQADVQNVDSGVCSGSITCTDYTPPCRTVNGVVLCENPSPSYGATEVLVPWSDFTSTIPEMCWFADVNIVDCIGQTNCIGNPACVNDCADLPVELQPACLADPCWVDAQGNTICLDDTSETWVNNLGDPNYADDCKDLIDRPECALTPDVACIEGMEDSTDPTNINLCHLRQRFFDCGEDVTVPGTPGADDSDITCEAEIRCFGDECANTQVESNPDFARAAVAATTVTESTKDMTCDIQGDPLTCRIFDGADNRCKDPRGSYLGIIPDCCDMAKEGGQMAGNFMEYMQLARVTYRLAKDPMVASWLAQGSTVQSGLQAVVNAPGNIASAVKTPIVNGWNSVMSWAGFTPADVATQAEALGSTVTTSVTGFGPIQAFIAGGVDSFLRSIGADAFANSLFTVGADGAVTDWAADGFGEMVGNVFAVIGLIYTIYSVLKILGSIFFACEEEELAFGIQLVNRACHHVGTYCSKKVSFLGLSKCVIETQTHCCFSSPFARIMNEQLREQGIGPDWGTAREPNCEGIQISELENVDWDLVDLSEWEAIIFQAGLVPDPRNPPLNFIPTDLHPGDSLGGPSGTNEGATSTDINQDTINLIMDTTDSNRFSLETAPLTQPDPELMPWY